MAHHQHQHRHASNIVKLAERVAAPVAEPAAAAIGVMDHSMEIAAPNRLVEPRADSTDSPKPVSSCGANACEYPVSSSTFTLPVVLGIVIPVVGAAVLFFILHRRHVRKQREEDANDRHASLDFGLGNVPKSGRKLPKSNMHMQHDDEKDSQSRRQVSMDMAMTSPYLLPPELQNSRESIHSLSRSMHNKEDPYRPVSQFLPGDNRSLRSQTKQGSSIYTSSSHAPSRLHDLGNPDLGLLSNAEPMPRSTPPSPYVLPPRQNSLPKDQPMDPFDKKSSPPYPLPSEPSAAHIVNPISSTKLSNLERPNALGLAPQTNANENRDSYVGDAAGFRNSNNYLGAFIHEKDLDFSTPSAPSNPSPPAVELPAEPYKSSSPPPQNYTNGLPANPRPQRKESIPIVQPQTATFVNDNESDYGDNFEVTPPSPAHDNYQQPQAHRYSMDVPPEEYVHAGLGAPGFDARRLSMGFRPLPPDAATEHDDPEVRANRIRSFYKEYFDESKPAPQGQYYEDYDVNYLDQTRQHHMYQQQGHYDPGANAFVMPYAEPVTRRAMTPPPGGMRPPPRFQGGPRPRNGSMGAMSTMSGGGRRGPQMYPPGPYPQGPKAFSTASGRMGPPKRQLPPPSPLNTLPTPSKLKDDSFALMNSLDFAPPTSYRERVQGRSESPLGERRPYSPAVPAFAPIASSFDELAAIPSPHMLRKSGTFTSLDFAAPKKFRDPDTMSDAGSIRSNRSGVSAMHSQAIRNGAYRVSKIPQDVVFTKDDLATTLKPQWGMRPGN